ncbi:gluconate transporter [Fulvivirga sp. M361]|uniref:GntP family permease n=1 Tax=Fulvivirga sp. M361 TaxID=2594266 RepID=UPI00117A14CA|nr:gluconate:H+ symporter [Fulvivirga sp. M361]TRX59538.1 gluconate transporter [Fulvivirga sp. M361]
MIDLSLLAAVILGICLLLLLVLQFKLQAFISLLISSIAVGIIAGMDPLDIISTIQEGMANTLGFVAVVVGLGSTFGAILEHSGGAGSLANYLLEKFGEKRASWALMLTGFLVAIPVFFDVAFIILIPLVYALQRKTGKSLILYAIPLLAGLAITHAFIPPTPGPVAVADILKADLGWVIVFGFIAGIPTAILCGPVFGKYIGKKIKVHAPYFEDNSPSPLSPPPVGLISIIIAVPIVLIVANTVLSGFLTDEKSMYYIAQKWLQMIGHPFVALVIANLLAWYFLGLKKGFSASQMLDITTKSMAPAGIIILLTGAGGVFKQMMINTGAGEMMATYFADAGMGILFFAFLAAVLVRVLQGSSTVAMITAAGLVAPTLTGEVSELSKALLVIAIASGASMASHVNDSGFWLVSKYLGITEKETFHSWTVMTSLLALTGFVVVMLLSLFFGV